jgi:tetratricopeptide (TPR) repeat protein
MEGDKEVDKAIEFFKLNVANYPDSYNAYDSLAEAYRVKGEKARAIESFEKSLKLNPANEAAAKQLQELRGQ